MTARAFVIAIEDYSAGNYLPSLPGAHADADRLIKWLIDNKGVKKESIICCAGDQSAWRTHGTTRAEIVAALKQLVAGWADQTTELYFFFSGHGFSFQESPANKPADVLVAADFTDLVSGGGACLRLNEIQVKLWRALGSKRHYYFIDACRNLISQDAIEVPSTGLAFPPSALGTPTVYVLFSTAQGAPAKTSSGFTQALVTGLAGGGQSKGWRGRKMYVMFDRLGKYVRDRLFKQNGQEVKFYKEGEDIDGIILELSPPFVSVCRVQIENAGEGDQFRLTVSDARGFGQQDRVFTGAAGELALPPEEYFVELTHASGKIVQLNPPQSEEPLDLYDSLAISFRLEQPAAVTRGGGGVVWRGGARGSRGGKPPAPAPPPPPMLPPVAKMSEIELENAPPQTEFLLTDKQTGAISSAQTHAATTVSPGSYTLKLREGGITVASREVVVKPGERLAVDLLERPASAVHQSILLTVTGDETSRLADFSEQLGPIANWDLSLWLALLGASRIVAPPAHFEKLGHLPLANFEDVAKGDAPVYVLAAFERAEELNRIGLGAGTNVSWQKPRKVQGMVGVYEFREITAPGPRLLSFKIGAHAPVTFAVCGLPNRATFFTLVQDEQGNLAAHQYLLPLHHLQKHLDPFVRARLGQFNNAPLRAVRTMALAQYKFARLRSVCNFLAETDAQMWDEMLKQKWLDPVMSLIAAYDIIRRGQAGAERQWLKTVVKNLRKYFAGLPDAEAIAKLIGEPWTMPASPPLLLDGVLAFGEDEEQQFIPFASHKLDYESPWTAWRGAVEDAGNRRAQSKPATRKARR